MKTEKKQNDETGALRANISILTRGGAVTIHSFQNTNPVLLQGMELPAEAHYEFPDPTSNQAYAHNNPVSIELFFGDSGYEADDISLGRFQLSNLTTTSVGSGKIKLKLAISIAQILSILVLDHASQYYRAIGFIDLSNLEPPDIKDKHQGTAAEVNTSIQDQISKLFTDPQPRKIGKPRHGKDIVQDLTISFEEALYGVNKEINVSAVQTCLTCNGSGVAPGKALLPCSTCSGTGWKKEEKQTDKGPVLHAITCPTCNGDGLTNTDPCLNCKGSGWVKTMRLITLQIPRQIESGAEICMVHQGEFGQYGGHPGHLRISTHVAVHPLFTRIDNAILIRMPISASFAKQGGYLYVPDIKKGNPILVKLPANVKSDMTFQVLDGMDYTLAAKVEIYYPALLFMQSGVKDRLQMVKEWLGKPDYELAVQPGNVEVVEISVLKQKSDEKTDSSVTLPRPGSTRKASPSPNQAIFYIKRGTIYENKGDLDRALADYNQAVQRDPEHANAYDKRGSLYLLKNDLEKSLTDLNRALELDSKLVHAYNNRGKLHFKQNHFRAAVEDFEKSLSLYPRDIIMLLSLGQAYHNLGDHEKAMASYQEVINSSQDPHLCKQARLLQAHLKKASYKEKASQFNETLEQYVSFDDLFGNVPTNFTEQKDWKKWENEYVGKHVKGKGRFVSFSIHPQVGKLFFILSIDGGDGAGENGARKVALWIDDAKTVKLGEKEGSFLIDDTKWIQMGENFTLEGRVSEFSLLDPELGSSENGNLIIIKGKKTDIEKEVI